MPDQADGEQLLAAIQRLGQLMRSRQVSSRIAAASGAVISQQGVQILRVLLRDGEQPIAGLATAAHMNISAVSRQIRPLEDEGLVCRAAAENDGRVALVSLTTSGRRLAYRIKTVGLDHLHSSLADWSEPDVQKLGQLLARLVDDLQHTEIVPPAPKR